MKTGRRTIVVAGDVSIDWMLVTPGASHAASVDTLWKVAGGFECRLMAQAGGAALTAAVVGHMVGEGSKGPHKVEVLGPRVPAEALASPSYERLTQTYTSWEQYSRAPGNARERAWRVANYWGGDPGVGPALTPAIDASSTPDYLVMDDLNLGFKDDPANWAGLFDSGSPPRAIILRAAPPLAAGRLWDELIAGFADIMTVVVPVFSLRIDGVQISDPLSWERTFVEVEAAMRGHALSRAARVVVLLGAAGAVVIPRGRAGTLFFDPYCLEGDWESRSPGDVFGSIPCVTACLLRALLADEAHLDRDPDVRPGLEALRVARDVGYRLSPDGDSGPHFQFPFADVTEALASSSTSFAQAGIPSGFTSDQTLLGLTMGSRSVTRVAFDAALSGPEGAAFGGVPLESVGAWQSVDRREIESVRSVRNIMAGYVDRHRRGLHIDRPLSVAVFGPPGSGKSFVVKQIAEVLLPGELVILEANLSQLRGHAELAGEFHKVRDAALAQCLPLVFWDEFDTPLDGRSLGWLKHMLAPMQDGVFRDGSTFHPLGPSLFVFAGGTSPTMQDFVSTRDEAAERESKKPDFLSRLRGYIDIFGPDRQGESDDAFVLRRAFLLRSMLKRKAPQVFHDGILSIDEGVLRAFILVGAYVHGARSMEAIIDMSTLAGKLTFHRSSLPSEHQLALHVDAPAFLRLLQI